jgi:hypothetical protein
MYEIRRVGEHIKFRTELRTAPQKSSRIDTILSTVPPLRSQLNCYGSSRNAFGLILRHQATVEAELAGFERPGHH